ncbi:MAG TPA: glycosyltransferase family 4 protein [Opitutaceae bacterium]|jgi:glycosyltransferase involved in cell wall biosynthesis|nr:glycosyltransferase family 4 protein [Opitutaceae bacterium]
MNSPRLAIVLSHPNQYYSPWFRWLRTHTALEFRVFYLWKFGVEATRDPQFGKKITWDVDLLGGYESEFVPNVARDPGTHHFMGLRNPELTARLAAWRPDALLLFGYAYASHLRVIAWARCHGVPLIFRGDSHLLGRPALPGWKNFLFRTLYRQFAALTCVGAANRDYFLALGVPGKKLFLAPHSVNHEHFDPSRDGYRAAAQALRAQLGLAPDTRVVLFAGKLTAAKQPRELLEAFLALDAPGTALVFVGDGEEKSALLDRARTAPPGRMHFLPFANQSEMPARYLLADIFALPSRGVYETWGLAVNEAMHMGAPCLVSDRVGCQRDLVLDGETGWVFRAGDAAHLQEKLAAALATPPAQQEKIKRAVADKISHYTYAQTTEGFLRALALAAPK